VSVLEEIVQHKRAEVEGRRARHPLDEVMNAASSHPPARDFIAAVAKPGLSVVAEIKRRSPAKGNLSNELNPTQLARAYEAWGASALSVLTDDRFFGGSDSDLLAAKATVSLPILRKDFTIDVYQLYEARALGADAVLLIVRALPGPRLQEFLSLAAELGMAALVEVHDDDELERAVEAGAGLIGVNNRNLDTLAVHPETSFRLKPLIPAGVVSIAESGIATPELAQRLATAGYDAILVGEALVTAHDPGALLATLRAAAQAEGARAPSSP
jgi:indole-3-glycerol phosphate synthase